MGFAEMGARFDRHRDDFSEEDAVLPTLFQWRDPRSIPRRPWLYGRHLIRGQVSVTVAPGGIGKSSLTICEALAMASGRPLLDEWVAGKLNVWIFNLEDPRDELDRRIIGGMIHYGLAPEDVVGRLYVDTGRERELCTAMQNRNGVEIVKPEIEALERQIRQRKIDVLVVDPFVSSHRVPENDNGAIDLVAKEWARLASRCCCAIELVHHTRKLNGEEGTTESGRGAIALLAAARSGRVLNRMTDDEKAAAGIASDPATYFSISRDKANLAPVGKREWRRMASVDLGNGDGLEPSDSVGVVVNWEWPDAFDGVKLGDLLAVQRAVDSAVKDGNPPRFSDQANGWVGEIIAEIVGLDAKDDRTRIKKILGEWLKNKALVKVEHEDAKRNKRPCVEVGEWATE